MKNADMPAMPLADPEIWADSFDLSKGTVSAHGLTKREYFAGLAMQGLLANQQLIIDMTTLGLKGDKFKEVLSITAIQSADSLLAELEAAQ